MKRYGVRLSVCPSMGPQQQTRSCKFAVVGTAGRRYRLLQQRRANAGSATLSAYAASWTRTDLFSVTFVHLAFLFNDSLFDYFFMSTENEPFPRLEPSTTYYFFISPLILRLYTINSIIVWLVWWWMLQLLYENAPSMSDSVPDDRRLAGQCWAVQGQTRSIGASCGVVSHIDVKNVQIKMKKNFIKRKNVTKFKKRL